MTVPLRMLSGLGLAALLIEIVRAIQVQKHTRAYLQRRAQDRQAYQAFERATGGQPIVPEGDAGFEGFHRMQEHRRGTCFRGRL